MAWECLYNEKIKVLQTWRFKGITDTFLITFVYILIFQILRFLMINCILFHFQVSNQIFFWKWVCGSLILHIIDNLFFQIFINVNKKLALNLVGKKFFFFFFSNWSSLLPIPEKHCVSQLQRDVGLEEYGAITTEMLYSDLLFLLYADIEQRRKSSLVSHTTAV